MLHPIHPGTPHLPFQQKHFPSLSGPLQVFPNLILLGAHFQLSSKTAFFSANFKRKKQNHSSSHSQHSWSILSSRITLQNPQLLPSRQNFARLLQEAKDKMVHFMCTFYNHYQVINKQAGKTLIIIPYLHFFPCSLPTFVHMNLYTLYINKLHIGTFFLMMKATCSVLRKLGKTHILWK